MRGALGGGDGVGGGGGGVTGVVEVGTEGGGDGVYVWRGHMGGNGGGGGNVGELDGTAAVVVPVSTTCATRQSPGASGSGKVDNQLLNATIVVWSLRYPQDKTEAAAPHDAGIGTSAADGVNTSGNAESASS